jgi:hypothetical protein
MAKNDDRFVLFMTYEGQRKVGLSALHLRWSPNDVLIELKSKGYPLGDQKVQFKGWPSDTKFKIVEKGDKIRTFTFIASPK